MPNNLKGLIGAGGIWLTAGLALPVVNVLDMFSPAQLMAFRGLLTAVMAFIGLRGIIRRVDKYTWLIALALPFATLGLFQGIRLWGAGPTIVMIAATPVLNFAVEVWAGKRVSRVAVIGLVLVLAGVATAILPEANGGFNWIGFMWATFATLMNGVIYELFARAKSRPLEKCLWGSVGMGTLGLLLSLSLPGAAWEPALEFKTALILLYFVFVGGLLYWLANLATFKYLPTGGAAVLAQGETPAVVVGAALILRESLTSLQWAGVIIALVGASYLAYWLSRQPVSKEASAP